jgi:hypothetical protein
VESAQAERAEIDVPFAVVDFHEWSSSTRPTAFATVRG